MKLLRLVLRLKTAGVELIRRLLQQSNNVEDEVKRSEGQEVKRTARRGSVSRFDDEDPVRYARVLLLL